MTTKGSSNTSRGASIPRGGSSSSSSAQQPPHASAVDGEVKVKEESLDAILQRTGEHESILIVAKDKVGKSSALLSMAVFIIRYFGSDVWVIDTENGIPPILASWNRAGLLMPEASMFHYWHVTNMNEVLSAFDQIMERHQRGDWVMVDSMGKTWEMAQDHGYKLQSGMLKEEYLAKRRAQGGGRVKGSPLPPDPDKFWNVVKDAHDANFMDAMQQDSSINYLWIAGLNKPPNTRDNKDRANFRDESGIDMNVLGAPKLPYTPDTVILLRKKGGKVVANVLGDRNAVRDEPKVEYDILNRHDFASAFYYESRGLSEDEINAVLEV